MYLEAEVYGMLNWGFGLVMIFQLAYIIFLWVRYKFRIQIFIWFAAYIVVFALAGYQLLTAINLNVDTTMGSEMASLHIGYAGLLWMLSIICLIVGLSLLVSRHSKEKIASKQ